MKIRDAIRSRRSAKRYTDRPVGREEVEALLEAARWAPNHRMTEPWEFYVLGREAHATYAAIRAEVKSEPVDDPAAAEAVREKVEEESLRIPRLLGIASHVSDDPAIREEDFAAVWMGVQNLLLQAWEMGLSGYIRTGPILEDSRLRQAMGIPDEQRLLAVVQVGEPDHPPDPKPRVPAAEKTRWLD